MNLGAPVRHHPNASLAAASGSLSGAIVWALSLWGVTLTAYDGIYVATAVITATLAIGRRGIRGLARTLWRGTEGLEG